MALVAPKVCDNGRMNRHHPYSIGTPGTPWGPADKAAWAKAQKVQRSYADEVLRRIEDLRQDYAVHQYGQLDIDPERYPLYALRSLDWAEDRPVVLVTGGVHGYETSGVQGALLFAAQYAANYAGQINLLIAPCVSPWGYERIQRWNPYAVDPNRSFGNRAAQESAALVDLVMPHREQVLVHLDLHETTNSDEEEFRPALAARDGSTFEPGTIPDGFYLVGDSEQPQRAFNAAIIDAVSQVTHIAPADEQGRLIGDPIVSEGLIEYPVERAGLCAGVTPAPYRSTTEVYPDSPRTTPAECNKAQAVAVCAAIDYALAHPD